MTRRLPFGDNSLHRGSWCAVGSYAPAIPVRVAAEEGSP